MKIKWLALLLILFIAILTPSAAETSALSSTVASNQIVGKLHPPEVTIIEENETGITLKVEFFGFQRSQTEEDGLVLDVLTIPSCGHTGMIGEPAIPQYGTALEIPFDVDFVVHILDTSFEDFTDYLVYPVQMLAADAEEFYYPPWPTPPFYINGTFYDTFNDFYPAMIVKSEVAGILRDMRVLPLQFAAFQHNPVQRLLRFFWSITLRIDYITGPALMSPSSLKLPAKTSPYFERFYSGLVNHKPLPTRADRESQESSDPGCDYLIITDSTLEDAADRIAARRNAEGLSTMVVTTVDIPWAGMLLHPEDIKAFIQTAYDTWDPRPSYLLLLGDAELIPTFYQTVHCDAGALYPTGFRIGTDLYYAILNGPEAAPPYFSEYWTPDIFLGRIPADTLGQANAVVDKIFAYEDNQWISGENTALVSGYFQDDRFPYNGYEDRRFILTLEEIRDFLLGEGFDVERLYNTGVWPNGTAVNPTNHNNGIYDAGIALPPDLRRPTYPWDADTADITNAINDGRFIVFHRDHGGSFNRPSSSVEGWGDPQFEDTDVPALNNNDHYTIVFSVECETGWFDGETDGYTTRSFESLSEALLRESDGGAVGVFGATRESWSGWNDDLAKGFVDAIWPNFDSGRGSSTAQMRMGEILNYGKWYTYTINGWSSNVRRKETIELFHYFGDPTMAFKIPTLVVHDVSADSQTHPNTQVLQGTVEPITVGVSNNGNTSETFDVTVYYDSNVIGTQTVTDLAPLSSTTLAFNWDTTGVPPATYAITAWADSAMAIAELDEENNWCTDPTTISIIYPVYVDIKPGSWPNPLGLKSKGVLPVAVCGTEEFDVTTIDPETIRLTLDGVGVAPLRWSYEDVATPYTGEPCSGHDLEGDGYLDLTLKFKTQEVIQTLGLDAFSDGDIVILTLTGSLKAEHGGTLIQGQDCVRILKK